MHKKHLWWLALGLLLVCIALIQFVPANPVSIPVELPLDESPPQQLIKLEGIASLDSANSGAPGRGLIHVEHSQHFLTE